MTKTKLAETGIIVIILVLIYQLVISSIGAITGFYFFTTSTLPSGSFPFIMNLVIPVVLYISAIYLLSVYKTNLASWLGGSDEQDIVIDISPVSVVYIAIFIISLGILLTDLPALISQSVFSNNSHEVPPGLGMSESFTTGSDRILQMARIELFIRLFLAVVFLAISSVKLFSGSRKKQEAGLNEK
jgi:hypothetical protein